MRVLRGAPIYATQHNPDATAPNSVGDLALHCTLSDRDLLTAQSTCDNLPVRLDRAPSAVGPDRHVWIDDGPRDRDVPPALVAARRAKAKAARKARKRARR